MQLAYAIGVADPVSVHVDTFGTGKLPESRIVALIREHFSLTPKGIIETLNLRRPIYKAPRRSATSAGDCPSSPGSRPTGPRRSRGSGRGVEVAAPVGG